MNVFCSKSGCKADPFRLVISGVCLTAAVVLLLGGSPALAAGDRDLDVPLVVENNTPDRRQAWPARGGVPLPAGVLQPGGLSGLAVVDEQGRSVPAQFEPLALWWGRGGSVKWLLVDLLADVPPNGRADYRLVRGKGAAPSGLQVLESKKSVIVNTGPLRAVISRTRGTVIDEIHVDRNGDGRFGPDERVIRPDETNGSIVRSDDQDVVFGQSNEYNMWGTGGGRIQSGEYIAAGRLIQHDYGSGFSAPEEVAVETRGPLRATIRVEGSHAPREKGDGILDEGFYHYTVWLHFYAGKAHLDIEHSLDNHRRDVPMRIHRIREARMQFALDDAIAARSVVGEEGGGTFSAPLSGRTISLLQDSGNLERWDLVERLAGKRGEEAKSTPGYFFRARMLLGPAAFRGYKVVPGRTWPEEATVLAQGDRAPGWAGVDGDRGGLTLFMQDFWIECPKAIRVSPHRVEAVFLPGFSPEEFQVHSSARKSHALTLAFHTGPAELERRTGNAEAHLHPLLVRTVPEQIARSGAYPRHLGVEETKKSNDRHWYPHSKWHLGISTANWRTAGMYKDFNGGGMHPNYWSIFHQFLRGGGLWHWEEGRAKARWASEWLPWLIHDYSFSSDDPLPQHRLVGWGPKELYTHREATRIDGWVRPYTTNIPAFTSPAKVLPDGEHLMHMWPLEWYYLTGSPVAREGVMALGNQAKYSTHRHFFRDVSGPAPSLDHLFYFDDEKHPERDPRYFYTRIFASHLLSTAWTYGATGDEASLFYARWLARRILYLQRKNGGTLGGKRGWGNIPPWMEAEAATAAYALYRETGDEALLDIMGSWLEWVWHEAYRPGHGMPHRFERGKAPKGHEHHWYPGVAAPLCYAALGDPRALQMTEDWAAARLPHIKRGHFLRHPAGQSAAYVMTYLRKQREGAAAPEPVTDLRAEFDPGAEGIVLTWTAPRGAAADPPGAYWIKYSDRPIVAHPAFPEELGKRAGFFHADNVEGEPAPAPGGTRERFVVKRLAPHGAYGSTKALGVGDLEPGTYHIVLRSWSSSGILGPMSNVAEVSVE